MAARRPRFSIAAAPLEKPFPLWILYPLFFVGIYLAHYKLLRLPWFWDEAGYYIPAALDFFRTGTLIPTSTLTNAHPTLPSILLAAWWHLTGYVISGTRTFIVMVAAAALLAVFRLARELSGTSAAVAATLLTALYPVWFAQSTLAHADIFAAAFTLWALCLYFERHRIPQRPTRLITFPLVAILFACAALAKETAIITPIALAVWEAVLLITERAQRNPTASYAWMGALLFPVLPLAGWYLYHWHHTGFIFGNAEFLRYNATNNFSAHRILLSLWHRVNHLTIHMNMYVAVMATGAALFLPKRPSRVLDPALCRPALLAIAVVVVSNALAFSILGGALLTRYLLPLYPLLLLVMVAVWRQRLRAWWMLAALCAAAFITGLFVNPPYSFAPEDNLTYASMVRLHQQAASVIAHRFPGATVLTAWPATTELQHPELGYVLKTIATVALNNFAQDQIEQAAHDPGAFDTALVFSMKWTPPRGFSLTRATESSDRRFFDYHRDLSPAEIATLLHGEVVWQGSSRGEWAAVLRFPRSNVARLDPAVACAKGRCTPDPL